MNKFDKDTVVNTTIVNGELRYDVLIKNYEEQVIEHHAVYPETQEGEYLGKFAVNDDDDVDLDALYDTIRRIILQKLGGEHSVLQ